MRKWIDLFENASEEVLYHASPVANHDDIIANGVRAPSYWAVREIAEYYAEDEDCVIYAAPLSMFEAALLEPDYPGIEEPVTYTTIGKREKQVHAEWAASDGTWQDSLEIVGSLRYNGTILPTLWDS